MTTTIRISQETGRSRTVSANREGRVVLRFMLVALVGGLPFSGSAQAAILGINTPATSGASIIFNDLNSVAPPAGVTSSGPSVVPWNGSTVLLPLTTDPNTADFAKGSIVGSFIPSSNTYSLNFNSINLSQAVGNTGFADLVFQFNIEYQLDAAGLPAQATLFPNFVVNGTVQSSAGSFAAVSGFINYEGVNTAGTISVLDTVNYGSTWNSPGPFSGTAVGVPINGFTPALIPNTTLTLDGVIRFRVDPASINVQSVPAPEPSTCVLAAFGALGLLAFARRRRS